MDAALDPPEGPNVAQRDEVAEFFRVAMAHSLELEAVQVFKRIAKLEQLSCWDEGTLRAALGCDLTAFAEAGPERAPRSLALSDEYLTWLQDLVLWIGDGPAPSMVRRIVVGARSLFDGAGGERDASRLERCRAAMATEHGVPFRPRDYLELGEVQRAFDLAAAQLEGTAAAERARLVESARAPFDDVAPHIAPGRLAYLGTRTGIEQLGAGVHDAIVEHLHSGCAACNGALPRDVELPEPAARQQSQAA